MKNQDIIMMSWHLNERSLESANILVNPSFLCAERMFFYSILFGCFREQKKN